MDWDSHRYLECFFAIPMMGAVLHTINVRMSPEQILYTINHAEDDVVLVNGEFLPLLESFWDQISTVKKIVLLNDATRAPVSKLDIASEFESLLDGVDSGYAFPELDENTRATTFYTTGTTGLPKGVYFSHRQLVLHTLAVRSALSGTGHGRLNADDVYMPLTPMFHVHAWGLPYVATTLGVKQVYPGRYEPDVLLELVRREKVTFSHCVPTILQMLLASASDERSRPQWLEDDDRRCEDAADACQARAGGGRRRLHRLRHVRDLPGPDGRASPVTHGAAGTSSVRPRCGARPAARSRWCNSASSTRP